MTKAVKHRITMTVEVEFSVNPEHYNEAGKPMNTKEALECDLGMDPADWVNDPKAKILIVGRAIGLLGETLETAAKEYGAQ